VELAPGAVRRHQPGSAHFDSTLCVSRWPPSGTLDADTRGSVDELSANGVKTAGPGTVEAREMCGSGGSSSASYDATGWTSCMPTSFGPNVWGTLVAQSRDRSCSHEHSWSYEGGRVRDSFGRELIRPGSRSADRGLQGGSAPHGGDRGYPPARNNFRSQTESRALSRPADTMCVPNSACAHGDCWIGSVGSLLTVKAFECYCAATALLTPTTTGRPGADRR